MKQITRILLLMLAMMVLAVPAFAQDDTDTDTTDGTIVDYATNESTLSILLQAVQAADPVVIETLQGDDPVTLLAPSNQAFENLLATLDITAEELLEDTELLTDILLYHVIDGEVAEEDIRALDGDFVPTLLDDAFIGVSVEADDTVLLNEIVAVSETDIETSNGVVHILDDVLLPTSALEAFDMRETVTSDVGALRAMHLSPDAPNVDMYVNGRLTYVNLEYGEAVDYIIFPADTYEITVAPVGTSIDDAVLGPVEVTVSGGDYVNIAATGSVDNDTLGVTVFTQAFPSLEENEVNITALHALEGAPNVDVVANSVAVISDLAYPGTQTDDDGNTNDGAFSTSLDAMDLETLSVNLAETETILLDLSDTALNAGSYYVVAVAGTVNAPEVFVHEVTADLAAEYNNAIFGTDEDAMDAEATPEATPESTEEVSMTDDMVTISGNAEATIAEIVSASAGAEENPEFTILLQALQNADAFVLETLSNPDNSYTVLAPTDAAFGRLLSTTGLTAEELLESDLLTDILLYHVAVGELRADMLVSGDPNRLATLLENNFVGITIEDGSPILNDVVNVQQADVTASNGVIHVIDEVLLPVSAIEALGL